MTCWLCEDSGMELVPDPEYFGRDEVVWTRQPCTNCPAGLPLPAAPKEKP